MATLNLIPSAANAPAHGINNHVEGQFISDAYEHGKKMGEGLVSELRFLNDCVVKNADGALSAENAERYWSTFRRGVAENKGAAYIPASSEKNRASVVKAMLKLGRLKFGEDVFDRACDIIKDAGEIKQSNTRDALYGVATAQLKKGQVDVALTDDQIREVLAVQEKARKTEAQRLKQMITQMERLRDGTKDGEDPGCPSPELTVALNAIGARLVDISVGDKDMNAWLVKKGYRV